MSSHSSDLPVCPSARLPRPSSHLLFDAVGTLIYAEPAPAAVYEAVGRRHGSRLTVTEIERRFREAFAAEEAIDRRDAEGRTREERELRRWRAIVAAVLDDVSNRDDVFVALWSHFARPDAWRAYDDAAAVIPQLTAGGTTVGVASNFDARLHAILAAHFPAIRPERVFVSSELGYRKPARGFFAECERRLSASRSSCVLIGDDVENDFVGARCAGWAAVLLDRCNRHAERHPRVADLLSLIR